MRWSDSLERAEAAGRIHLGGCCVSSSDPDRHCNECEADFFTGQLGDTELTLDVVDNSIPETVAVKKVK